MNTIYVLDACALIAFLNDEPGADVVESLLNQADLKQIELFVNTINVLEAYYGVYHDDGLDIAKQTLEKIREFPVTILQTITDDVFYEAGKLKASYSISLADAIATAEANVRGAPLVTADHHEFDELASANIVNVHWIR